MLAYNHEQFIGEALASVLAQQVDFPYTIIVGEDCSTDGTRAIVESYRQRYPDRIKPIYQAHNLGPGANLKACLAACQAPYIAALDGDDYWTDPGKLAKQVAWLDANPDFAICFHLVDTFHEGSVPVSQPLPTAIQTVYNFTEVVINGNMPAAGSLVLRNCRPSLPDWLFETYPIDMPLLVLYGEMGKAKLLPERMGRYRLHPGSTWSSQPAERNRQRQYAMFQLLMQHYEATPHRRHVQQVMSKLYLTAADEYVQRGLPAQASPLLRRAARLWPAYTPRHAKSLLGVTLRWLRSYVASRPAAPTLSA
jgi:glycosyltransferase involved in cell wall biosynthesis